MLPSYKPNLEPIEMAFARQFGLMPLQATIQDSPYEEAVYSYKRCKPRDL